METEDGVGGWVNFASINGDLIELNITFFIISSNGSPQGNPQ
jgi:hypothetical protein